MSPLATLFFIVVVCIFSWFHYYCLPAFFSSYFPCMSALLVILVSSLKRAFQFSPWIHTVSRVALLHSLSVEESSTTLMDREGRMTCLKDTVPAAENNINTQFIVLDKGRKILEGQNKTCLALVADETASVHFQFWGDECDAFEPSDIIHLANGIFSYNRNNNLVLRAGRRGAIKKVGEFTMVFVETPNMSEITWVPDPDRPNKYMQDSVISSHSRVFPPLP